MNLDIFHFYMKKEACHFGLLSYITFVSVMLPYRVTLGFSMCNRGGRVY
ncbi:hypothetical protein SAMN05444364_103111 [Prevotella scopos JCM 17725]|uniref:Uncharacterized protein n=1 Tax=Prevotella scopos JCM 17725 TaxID=1236518 RepID=A0AAX2F1R1_9BACT|nr:hypothetical protein SAMN05444364_103111 [Prevotella scopos JCM 17725]